MRLQQEGKGVQEGAEAEKVRAVGEGTDEICAVESCLHDIYCGGHQERTPVNTDAGTRTDVSSLHTPAVT